MTETTIELKNYKTFHGHDGNGWEGSIYVDGKRIGVAVEDGWGGPLQVRLDNKNAKQSDELYNKAIRSVASLPKWEAWGMELDMHFDLVMEELAGIAELRKQASHKVLLRKNGDAEDIRYIKSLKPKQLTDELRQKIEAKFDGIVLNGTDHLIAKKTIEEVAE